MSYDKAKLGRLLGISIVCLALLLLIVAVVQVDRHPRVGDPARTRAASIGGDLRLPSQLEASKQAVRT